MTDEAVALAVRKVQSLAETIRNNVERVIIGKRDIIDLLIVALLSDGHVLIEDVVNACVILRQNKFDPPVIQTPYVT